MKAEVFAKPEVKKVLEGFVFVELYTDKPENEKLMDERFKSDGLPLYVMLDAEGRETGRLNRAEYDVAKFIAFLRTGLKAPEAKLVLLEFAPRREKARVGGVAEFVADVEVRGGKIASASVELEGPFEAKQVRVKGGRIEIDVLVRDAKAGKQPVAGVLRVKLEDGRTAQEKFTGELEILAKRQASGDDPLAKGLWFFLGLCVAGGAISLLMPCVYPLIPITLTFFIKQSGGSRGKTSGLAFMYGLGIIVTFTGLGFLLSIVLGAAGAQTFAANPWVNLVIGVLFVVLALSLLGWFELKLPGFITDSVAGGAPKQGFLGAFGLGLIFAVVTFTCTIPIAATLMAMAAQGKSGWALGGMFTYSLTMAAPFLVLAIFPGIVQKIPRSGGWLLTMKITTGFLELALAVYYLAKSDFSWGFGLISRDLNLAIWIAVLLAASSWLLGLWRFPKDDKTEHVGYARALWAIAFATLAFVFVAGLGGKKLGGLEAILPREKGKEYASLEDGLAAAKKEKKLVFLEFTGFS